MQQGFWKKLEKPIVGLAPMDGVTDAPMRFITAKYGRPDVIFTEFVSADGIVHGAKRLLRDFKFDEIERPVVAQLFGGDPEAFFKVAKLIVKMGFDGVDINMGCPARKVAGRGEGAGLIKNPDLAGEIIEAVRRGVGGKIPVSVKTRIGYDAADPAWWQFLATADLAAVTIHGRTFSQLYQGKADWKAIAQAGKVIKSERTIFLGNGDIENRKEGGAMAKKYGTDGVLIGRAAGGNPWVFKNEEVETETRLQVAIEHARKFEEIFPDDRFFIMRKHLTWYARGFDGAADLRQKLVLTNNADEVEKIVKEFSSGVFGLPQPVAENYLRPMI